MFLLCIAICDFSTSVGRKLLAGVSNQPCENCFALHSSFEDQSFGMGFGLKEVSYQGSAMEFEDYPRIRECVSMCVDHVKRMFCMCSFIAIWFIHYCTVWHLCGE